MTHPALGTPRQGPSGTRTWPLLVGLRHRSLGGDPEGDLAEVPAGVGEIAAAGARVASLFPRPHKPGAVGAPRAPATPLPSTVEGQDKRRGGPQGPTGT